MKKSSDKRPVFKIICWSVSIFVCLIAGMMIKTGIVAIQENRNIENCIAPFVGAAFLILSLIAIIWTSRKTNAEFKRQKEIKRLHPDEPWLWQSRWTDGKMTSSNKVDIFFYLTGAAVFSLCGWTGVYLCYQDIVAGDYVKLITLIFPFIGLILGYCALCSLTRYLKFGESTFQMACMPGIVGGELAGVIYTKANQIPEDGFVLKLQSIKLITSGSGKNKTTRQEILWEDTHKVSVDLGARGGDGKIVLPVSFAIPFECESSSLKRTKKTKLCWKLSAEAEFPGADFHCEFDVPVFKTPESQENFRPLAAEQSFSKEIPLSNLCAASGVKQFDDNGKVCFEFPLTRRFGAKLTSVALTIFFSGGIYFMPIICGALTLLLAAATVRFCFWYGKISADEHGIQIVTGFLGLRSHQFSRDQIKSLIYRETMNNRTQEFDLFVETTENDKPTLFGPSLQGETAARRLCEALESAIQMPNISKKVSRKEHLPKRLPIDTAAGFGARKQTPHGA